MAIPKTLHAAVVAAFFWTCQAQAEEFDAKVIHVTDGDTVTVLFVDGAKKTPRRIRLSGIDAPEKAQPFGTVAKEQLSQLAAGQVAHLQCRAADRYQRSICQVRVHNLDVNLRMIELGLAWHYKRYAATQPREEAASYAVSENAARSARKGLWRDLDTPVKPVPPWDWRRSTASEF